MPFLYEGQLHHVRFRPRRHRFSQGVYYCTLNVDELDESKNILFSIEKPNLFSFYTRDHSRRTQAKNKTAQDLRQWAQDVLNDLGVKFRPAQIWLTSFPRVLGYAFNPISFWHCYDVDGALRVVICEVNNTFGETHNYVICHPDLREITSQDWFRSDKVFHVSPFFPVSGRYDFRFAGHPLSGDQLKVDIVYYEKMGDISPVFSAGMDLVKQPMTWRRCLRAFFRFPLLTFYVIGNIHFQAIRLWFKKATFHRKPLPPAKMSTGCPKNTAAGVEREREISL